MRSFHAGLRASGKSWTSTIRPTRMSTWRKSSKPIVPSSLMFEAPRARERAPGRAAARNLALWASVSPSWALGPEAEGAQRRLQRPVVADGVGAGDRRRAPRGQVDVDALAGCRLGQQE